MWPSTSCPLSSFTLNIVFGRASTTSPSISIFSSLGKPRVILAGHRGAGGLDLPDVYRLRALVAGLFVVGDLGVLLERLEAVPLNAAEVDEEVAIALIWSDEAEALLVVEPLHSTRRHLAPSSFAHCAPKAKRTIVSDREASRPRRVFHASTCR